MIEASAKYTRQRTRRRVDEVTGEKRRLLTKRRGRLALTARALSHRRNFLDRGMQISATIQTSGGADRHAKSVDSQHGIILIHHRRVIVHLSSSRLLQPRNFSISFFCPKPGKLTSASPVAVPSRTQDERGPYFGWRTCVPGAKPPGADEAASPEDEACRGALD